MEVKMRYLSRDIAKHFGSHEEREIVHLPDNAKYENLLGLLKKKYEEAIKQLYGGKLKGETPFIFICEGRLLRRISDESINPDSEVLVASVDAGG